jgi:hypothetical protein
MLMRKNSILMMIGLVPLFHASFVVAQVDALSTSDVPKPQALITNKANTDASKAKWWSDKLSIYWDVQYTDWHSDDDARGHQTMMPFTLMYRAGHAEFGVRTAWIESVNTTPGREGKVSTMSDTALSVAYTQPLQRGWSIRYNLDYNLPTGKATLAGAEKNAIMDGNLVMQTRFGEGSNLTPGIVFTKVINANAALGFGVSHTVRGGYDPNGDVEYDQLNPGDETKLMLQGQYATGRLMLLGGVAFTRSGVTQVESVDYFRKGARTDVNILGSFSMPHGQSLLATLRYGTQLPDEYGNIITGNFEKESRNINGSSVFASLEYAKQWGQHALRLSGDWLSVHANGYDQFNDLYNPGRSKYSVAVGYDFRFNSANRFSVTLRSFRMRDLATPATLVATAYSGYSAVAAMNFEF